MILALAATHSRNPLLKPQAMKHRTITLLFIVSVLLGASDATAQVSDGKIAKIREAVAKQKAVKPKKARKLLVFSLTNGFRHGSIGVGAKAMGLLGESTGAFDLTHTEDFAVFEPSSLSAFDAVLMLNTTGEIFKPHRKELKKLSESDRQKAKQTEDRLKESLVSFVKQGKGLAGFHSATDTYKMWKTYNEMMGGAFAGHPWGAGTTVGVRVDDPNNILTKAFGGQSFQIQDEIYQFRNDTCHRDQQRVLLSLNPQLTDLRRGRRENGDYPISWVRDYGQGRIFYSSLGHNEHIYWNPKILAFYLAGLQFALGDLDGVETTPVPLPKD
ncbi:MAG: hypothetical protein M2R45_01743 [Verrucomicrobia subdivision 3 bacterium]|nr:hypothetical protein [Limisphaerales bacterium]MCS1413480.1 hypothetical protein [Limisphaerales bacterium]